MPPVRGLNVEGERSRDYFCNEVEQEIQTQTDDRENTTKGCLYICRLSFQNSIYLWYHYHHYNYCYCLCIITMITVTAIILHLPP